jgi:uncharacterized protein involved in exopolysaccharide biosynthesis
MADDGENGLEDLRETLREFRAAINYVRDARGTWRMPEPSLPAEATSWNFTTYEKYINQRFTDLALQLRERYEAQQTGVTAALAAAEKAVNAALIAGNKAVDKAEGAQQLRNEAQNEFRKSLSDLSGLMWTSKEGVAAVDSVRRELTTMIDNIDKKILALEHARVQATNTLRESLEGRVGILESTNANLQGKVWAISAIWAIIVLAVSVGVRFIGHG